MNVNEVNPKTLELIEKLNALATDSGATEAEAATAMKKMQELLFKHNLELAEVLAANPSKKAESPIAEDFISLRRRTHIHKIGGKSRELPPMEREWRWLLVQAIARTNFCAAYTYAEFGGFWLFGTKENMEAVKAIWTYASNQIEDLSYDEMTKYKKSGGWDNGRTWRRGWLFGCVDRIRVILNESWFALQQGSAGSTALVVDNRSAINAYVDAKWPAKKEDPNAKPKKVRKSDGIQYTANYTSGYQDGYAAGDRINVSRASSAPRIQ